MEREEGGAAAPTARSRNAAERREWEKERKDMGLLGGLSPQLRNIIVLSIFFVLLYIAYLGHLSTPSFTQTVVTALPRLATSGAAQELAEEDGVPGIGTESVFYSSEIFKLNYREMERKFKVYIYPDGDPNTFYQTPRKLTGKYASEGYFFQNIRESQFRTDDPDKADLFFIPISCHKMRGKGTSYEKMALMVQEYVEGLVKKYPYWNRTLGADHFFVTCHDIGVRSTENVTYLVKNSIRVVCSPSYNVGFIPHKDVALPQVLQPFALPQGGDDVQNRTVLGFWAGHRNSKIRVMLARLWENDTVLSISNNRISRAIGELVYQKQFYRTKFCICPGGSQVNSARITDSIHYACVPVILSDYYDLPFNDVLNWHKFSLILRERDVVNLKAILQSVTSEQYLALHDGVRQW
eukprot:c24003_g1_i2 orf=526-1752(-)